MKKKEKTISCGLGSCGGFFFHVAVEYGRI